MRRPVSPTLPLSTTGPLALAEFWNDLRFAIGNPRPVLTEAGTQNTTAGGEVIAASWGTRLWRFSVRLAAMDKADMDILSGRLHLLADGGRSFLAVPPFKAFPAADPRGLYLSGAAPQISTIGAGGRTVALSGLPGHYLLTAGDFIAFLRGTPARYELHQLVTGARANAAGLLPEVQVVPPLRDGVTLGTAVTLANPAMRAVMVPGTLRLPDDSTASVGGPSFDVVQTLRKSG